MSDKPTFRNFEQFIRTQAAALSDEELERELIQRRIEPHPFPLHALPQGDRKYFTDLHHYFDIHKSFIGLNALAAYSTAIGTAYYTYSSQHHRTPLAVWGCVVGMSSSGKTLSNNTLWAPLHQIQSEYDQNWDQETAGKKDYELEQMRMLTVIYRDAHIPTLVRHVLPDNPKGVAKFTDELLEWILSMNQLSRRDGADEQFWLSTWNTTPYSGIRSGKRKFVIPRPFANVIGGIQLSLLYRLYEKDRAHSGFIYRILFSLPAYDRVADPDESYVMPDNLKQPYERAIRRLYDHLKVSDAHQEPSKLLLSDGARRHYARWYKDLREQINIVRDQTEREMKAGIYGKIKEYALRFAGILTLADKAHDPNYRTEIWLSEEWIREETMQRATALADYFYHTAVFCYEYGTRTITAPPEVLQLCSWFSVGMPYRKMANLYYGEDSPAATKRMERKIKELIKLYPRVFRAKNT
jgi:hypothetical protein